MSSEHMESRVLRQMENKQKLCYNCNKQGHTKYECRQSPFISRHVEKRHEPDINNVVVIMEGAQLSDNIDLNVFMSQLLKSLSLSKKIKPEHYQLQRPWTHIHRKNDVKITFKDADIKSSFMTAVDSRKSNYDKGVIYNYGRFIDKSYKLIIGKQEHKLLFREDLPYDLDKMYTKALEIKEQFGVDCVMVGNQGKVLARKREITYLWCKNEDDLEKLKKSLTKQNTLQITRKRKLLNIMTAKEH